MGFVIGVVLLAIVFVVIAFIIFSMESEDK